MCGQPSLWITFYTPKKKKKSFSCCHYWWLNFMSYVEN
jgi:predicted alpha-1,6-mannanase (GH76 family)